MTLSKIAAVLGLDETDGVRVVPLTDADLAAAGSAPPGPNRAARRAASRPRKKRSLHVAKR